MKDAMERFISAADRHRIERCVREAERRTRGEIVVMLVPASDHYPLAEILGAAAFSFPAAAALSPVLGKILWVGPSNMWIFLGLLVPLFLGFREVVQYIPALKRHFIRREEMSDEVREAAQNQFFRKGLYRTREETGILIYISVFERSVWILGDRGIDAVVSEERWKEIAGAMTQSIKAGKPADGICQAVGDIGRILVDTFPVGRDDRNELPDFIVENEKP